jgi:riboflavin kinase/FMN adenylyltransferase
MVLNNIKSITIGSFDGVHIAHQKLINLAQAVVVIEHNRATLTPGWKRSFFINKPIFFYHLQKIKDLSALEFLQKLQLDFPNLEKIVIGYDFKFGKNITCSFGVTQMKTGDTANSIVTRVDEALYKAKNEGRNRVVLI